MTDAKNALIEHDAERDMLARLRAKGYFVVARRDPRTGAVTYPTATHAMLIVMSVVLPTDIVMAMVMIILPLKYAFFPLSVMMLTCIPMFVVKAFHAEFTDEDGRWLVRSQMPKDHPELVRFAQLLADETGKASEIHTPEV